MANVVSSNRVIKSSPSIQIIGMNDGSVVLQYKKHEIRNADRGHAWFTQTFPTYAECKAYLNDKVNQAQVIESYISRQIQNEM